MKNAVLAVALAMSVSVAGCDNDGSQGGDGITLDRDDLPCPDITLNLTTDGGFSPGTTVTFLMGDQSFDGSAVVLNDGSIACGLPDGAPPGTYDLEVDDPDHGLTHINDAVTLDMSSCPP